MCGCLGGEWLLPGEGVWLLLGGVWFLHGQACVVAPGGCMVAPVGGVHAGGMHGKGGHVWQRGCVPGEGGGMCGKGGACMVKGGMHGKRGACVVKGGCAWRKWGHVWYAPPPMRYGRSLRGRYASYWNAFLFTEYFH